MRHEKAAAMQAGPVPLFVDVDGTLTRADISLERFVSYALCGLWAPVKLLSWLLRGRAYAKAMVARYNPVDPTRLPYRPEVLELIRSARQEDRPVVLASASHWRNVARVARHLGLSPNVIATRGRHNAKAHRKLAAIHDAIGPNGAFDYVGDSRADICLWRAARRGWSVGVVPAGCPVVRLAPSCPSLARVAVKAMRPHQWVKNGLVLVPLATSGLLFTSSAVFKAVFAALFMSLVASAIYLVNDLSDIEADRAHRTKWKRPIANGDLSIPTAIGLSLLLGLAGFAGAWSVGGAPLLLSLLAYTILTTAYSFRIKAAMVADVIALASLYTVRIWIGATAIAVPLSFWLLLFSVFLFLSLAYLKRYIELRDAIDPNRLLSGRGYVASDLDVVMMAGVGSGMVSILVLALFANDISTARHYATPQLLWFICLPLLYWINRIWMMARRGQVDGDPVAFALRDPRSSVVGISIAVLFLMAQSLRISV